MQKRILALQTKSHMGDFKKCFEDVENLMKKAPKADFLFLPEFWATSWAPSEFSDWAQEKNGEIVCFLKELAKKYNINIIGGSYVQKTAQGLKNTCPVIDRDGKIIANYDKMYLFSPDNEDKYIGKGEKPLLIELEGLRLGISICYDIRFPELFRNYAIYNPHLLVNMSIWPYAKKDEYEILARARALENQSYFLALSMAGELIKGFNAAGNSLLISPFGEIKVQLNDNEGFLFAIIETNDIEKTRKPFNHLKNIRKFNYDVEIKE